MTGNHKKKAASFDVHTHVLQVPQMHSIPPDYMVPTRDGFFLPLSVIDYKCDRNLFGSFNLTFQQLLPYVTVARFERVRLNVYIIAPRRTKIYCTII